MRGVQPPHTPLSLFLMQDLVNSIKDAGEGSRLDGSFSRQRGFRKKFKKYGPSRTFQGETFVRETSPRGRGGGRGRGRGGGVGGRGTFAGEGGRRFSSEGGQGEEGWEGGGGEGGYL